MKPTDEEAIHLLLREYPSLSGYDLKVSSVKEFTDYRYITLELNGEPLMGGHAFVVDLRAKKSHRCPASNPPKVNCQTVLDASGPGSG